MKNIFNFRRKRMVEEELGLIDKNTPFAIREALEALYTNIIYLNIEDKCKKIALSSAVSGEGKSCLSANLAIAIAANAEEKRVLLIDTDLRSAGVSNLFGLDRSVHGLTEYIAGVDEKPNLVELPQHRITFMPAGALPARPQKIIGSQKMSEFLAEYSKQFDYIIIDTAPINIVSDALLLHDKINGYIIVTRSDYSDVNETQTCIEALERVNAEIFGIVLTSLKLKSNSRSGKYLKYNRYSKYSKYHGKYAE